jgi:hypothetical protein
MAGGGILRSSQLSAAILHRQLFSAGAAVQKALQQNLMRKIVDSPYHPLQLPTLFGLTAAVLLSNPVSYIANLGVLPL